MPHKYRYEKQPDGKLVRVQEGASEPEEPHDVLTEFAGLCRQEASFVKDIRDCRERIDALQPIVDEILADAADASQSSSSGTKSPLSSDELDSLDRLRQKLKTKK